MSEYLPKTVVFGTVHYRADPSTKNLAHSLYYTPDEDAVGRRESR